MNKTNQTKKNEKNNKEQAKEKVTIRKAIREIAKQISPFTMEDMLVKIDTIYPNRWKDTSIRTAVSDAVIDESKLDKSWYQKIHKFAFLYKTKDDKFTTKKGRKKYSPRKKKDENEQHNTPSPAAKIKKGSKYRR